MLARATKDKNAIKLNLTIIKICFYFLPLIINKVDRKRECLQIYNKRKRV